MTAEHLRPIDNNGHVPDPPGGPGGLAAGFAELARCAECGLISLHTWDCNTGLAVKDAAKLVEAAEVLERRWPGWTRGTPIAGVMRIRAERLLRSVS